MADNKISVAESIAEGVERFGGRAYYTGGYVRDRLFGKPPGDIDIDIFGLDTYEVAGVLDSIFSFKAYALETARNGYSVFKLPDMDLMVVPFNFDDRSGRSLIISLGRDFTVNCLFEDILTGEIRDPLYARRDIESKIIRAVSDDIFAADPNRVCRAARLAACLDADIHPGTISLMSMPLPGQQALEKLLDNTIKALLCSDMPSKYFSIMRRADKLDDWAPELLDLIDARQDDAYHKEGDVWNHTMRVLDQAAELRSKAEKPLGLMMAALCHDFGKPSCFVRYSDGTVHAPDHDIAGAHLARSFVSYLISAGHSPQYAWLPDYIENMVRYHVSPIKAVDDSEALRAIFDGSICPGDLLLLIRADRLGRVPAASDNKYDILEAEFKRFMEERSRAADAVPSD